MGNLTEPDRVAVVLGALLAASGCTGVIEDPPGTDPSAVPADGLVAPRVQLGRLSNREYDQSIRLLLHTDAQPSESFPADAVNGYDTVRGLSLSPRLFEAQVDAAQSAVEHALADDSSRAALLICTPAEEDDAACVRRILSAFARRAWRRPPTDDELDAHAALFLESTGAGDDLDTALTTALAAVLSSPNFLYRVELGEDPSAPGEVPLTAHELAARTAYFLTGGPPDDSLLAAADEGSILAPETLEREARRLIDQHGEALASGFVPQWLALVGLEQASRDADVYPEWSSALARSMQGEPAAFFASFLQRDVSAMEMLDAPYTYVDSRLAAFYGIEGSYHDEVFTRVGLPADRLPGLTGQAGVLTATSQETTSVIHRGLFVNRLRCSAPPPPPSGDEFQTLIAEVVASVPYDAGNRAHSAARRAQTECAGCHGRMDPYGMAYERYDAIGRFRTEDEFGNAVDPSDELPDGAVFETGEELVQILAADEAGFGACLVRQIFTYAIGTFDFDQRWLDDLYLRFHDRGWDLRELLVGIVTSRAFRHRGPLAPEEER